MEKQTQPIQPVVNSPITDIAQKKSSKNFLVIGLVVLLILILIVLVKFVFLGNSNKSEIVLNQNPVTSSTVSSTNIAQTSESVTKSTPLDSDVKVIDNDLNNLDNSLNKIDQGLNDQQVNLQ